MRRWFRLLVPRFCGLCQQQLSAESLVQGVQLAGMKRELIRCPLCADGVPPREEPTRVVPPSEPPVSLNWSKMGDTAAAREWLPYREEV